MTQLMPGFYDPDRDQKLAQAPYYVSEHVGLTFVYPKFAPDDRGRRTELSQEDAYKLYVGEDKPDGAEIFTSMTDGEDRVLSLVEQENSAPIIIDEERNRELMQMINPVPMDEDEYNSFRMVEPFAEAGHFILKGAEGLTSFLNNSFKQLTDLPVNNYEEMSGRTIRNYAEDPKSFMSEKSLADRLRESIDQERQYAMQSYYSDPDNYELPLSALAIRTGAQTLNVAATLLAFPAFIGLDVTGTYQESMSDGHEVATTRALGKAVFHKLFLNIVGRVPGAFRPDAAFRAGAARTPRLQTPGLQRTSPSGPVYGRDAGPTTPSGMPLEAERSIGALINKLFGRKRTAYETDRTFAVSPDGVAQRIGIQASERAPIVEALREAAMGVGLVATYEAADQAFIEVMSEYGSHMEMYKDLDILDRVGHAIDPKTFALFTAFGGVKYLGIPGTEVKGLKRIGDDLYRGGQKSTQAVAEKLRNLAAGPPLSSEEYIAEYFNILAKAEQFKFQTVHAVNARRNLFDPETTSTEILYRIRDQARFRMREGAHGRDVDFDPSLNLFLIQEVERAIEARGAGIYNAAPTLGTTPKYLGSTNPFLGTKLDHGEVQPAFFGKVPPRSLHNMGQLSRSINFMFPRPEDQYIPPPGIPDPVDLNKPIMSEQELNDMIEQEPASMDFLKAQLTEKGKILTYGQLLKKNGYTRTDVVEGIPSMTEVNPATLVYLADDALLDFMDNLVVPANLDVLSGIKNAVEQVSNFGSNPYGKDSASPRQSFEASLGSNFLIDRDLFFQLPQDVQTRGVELMTKYEKQIRFAEEGETPTFASAFLIQKQINDLTIDQGFVERFDKDADLVLKGGRGEIISTSARSLEDDEISDEFFYQAFMDTFRRPDLFGQRGEYVGLDRDERGLLLLNTAIPGSTFTAFDKSLELTVLDDFRVLHRYKYDGETRTQIIQFDPADVLPVDINSQTHAQSAIKNASLLADRLTSVHTGELPDAVVDDLIKAEQAGYLHNRDPRVAERGAEANPKSQQVLKELRAGNTVEAGIAGTSVPIREIVPFEKFQPGEKNVSGKKKLLAVTTKTGEKFSSLVTTVFMTAAVGKTRASQVEKILESGVVDFAAFAVKDTKTQQYVKDDSGFYYFSLVADDFGRTLANTPGRELVVSPLREVMGKTATGYTTSALEAFDPDREKMSNWKKLVLDIADLSAEKLGKTRKFDVQDGIFKNLGLSKKITNRAPAWTPVDESRARFAKIVAKELLEAYRKSSGNQEADLFDMVVGLGRGNFKITKLLDSKKSLKLVGHGRGDANFDATLGDSTEKFVITSTKITAKKGDIELGDALDALLLRTFIVNPGSATILAAPEFSTYSNMQEILGDKSLSEVLISAAREAKFRVVHFGAVGSRGGFIPVASKAKDPDNQGAGPRAHIPGRVINDLPFNVKASAPEPRPVPGSNKPKVVNGRVEHRNVGGATPPQKPPTGKPPAPPAGGAPDPDKGVRAPQSFLEATANLGKRIKGRKTIITPDYIVAKFFTEKGMAESRLHEIVDARASVKKPLGQRQLEDRRRALVRTFYQAAEKGANLAYNEGRKAARAKAESEFQRLKEKIAELKQQIKDNKDDVKLRQEQAGKIRQMIEEAELPRAIKNIIIANVTRGRMTTDEQMARLLDRTELLIQQAYYKGAMARAKAVMRLVQKKASQNPGENIALSLEGEAAVRAILNGAPSRIALRPLSPRLREIFNNLMQIEAFANSPLSAGIKARINEPTGSITQFVPDDRGSLGELQNAEASLNAIADDLMDVLAKNDAEAEGAALGRSQMLLRMQVEAAIDFEAAAGVGVFSGRLMDEVGEATRAGKDLSTLEKLVETAQAGGLSEFLLSADAGAEVAGGGTDGALYQMFDALHEAEVLRMAVNNDLEASYTQALAEAGLGDAGAMQEFSRTHNKGKEMSDDVLYALVDGEGKQILVDGSELVGICCTMTSGNMLGYFGKQIGDGFSERGFVTFDEQFITSVLSSMDQMQTSRGVNGYVLVEFFVKAFNDSRLAENTRNNLSRQFNRGEVESLTHSYMPASRFIDTSLHPNEAHALEFTTPEEVQNYLLAQGDYARGEGETLFLQKILGFKQESNRPLQIFDATRFLMNRARTQNATFTTLSPLKDILDVMQSNEMVTAARQRNVQGRLQELRSKFLTAARDQLGLPLADRTPTNKVVMQANRLVGVTGLGLNLSAFQGQQTSIYLANGMFPPEYRVNVAEVIRDQLLWQNFIGMFSRTLNTTEGKGPAAIAVHAGIGAGRRALMGLAQKLANRVGVKIFDKIDGQIMEMPEIMDLVAPEQRELAELMFAIDPQQVDRHMSGNTSLVSGFTAADLEFQTVELNQIMKLITIGIASNDLAACIAVYGMGARQLTDQILSLAERHKKGVTDLEGSLRDHMGIDHTAEIHDRAMDFFGKDYGNVEAMRPRMMEFLRTDVVGRLLRRRTSYVIRRTQPEFNALYAPRATMVRRENPIVGSLLSFSGYTNKAAEFLYMSHVKTFAKQNYGLITEARKIAMQKRVDKYVEDAVKAFIEKNPDATPTEIELHRQQVRTQTEGRFATERPDPNMGSYYNVTTKQAMAAWSKSHLLYYAIKRLFKLLLKPTAILELMKDMGEDPEKMAKEEFDALFSSFVTGVLTTPPSFGVGSAISHSLGFSWNNDPALISQVSSVGRDLKRAGSQFEDQDGELNYFQQTVGAGTYATSGVLNLLALLDPRFALFEAARRQTGRVLSLRDTLELMGIESTTGQSKPSNKKKAQPSLGGRSGL